MKEHASIFNDVLGPVMIGPSSSHTAASVRIGRALRQMVVGKIIYFQADFDPEGSLAASYITQCSDIGLVGGLLGMDPTDNRLTRALEIAEADGMEIVFRVIPYENNHPNTDLGEELDVTALSVGGGMIEITEINHFAVEVTGGFYETLLFGESLTLSETDLEDKIDKFCSAVVKEQAGKTMLHIKTQQEISEIEIAWLNKQMKVERFIAFDPVLPIMSQKEPKMLFSTAEEMIALAKEENLDLADMALRYESHRGSISEEEVYKKAEVILEIMENGIQIGLTGTSYEDRMLGSQAPKIRANRDRLIGDALPAKIIENISALMEVKSSMNVFVAAPTAGSCGALPGTLIAVSDYQKKSHDELVRALLAAGMIGVFIAEYATFAAEVAGCQAECGSGSGMTAGALVQLMGGTIEEAVNAASMGLQNVFGMTCDPIGVRVEVPCLGKNMMCGMNALGAANMALAGYDVVIPLDETIESFNKVGRMIPASLRCTGHAGLAQTPSGLAIAERLGCPLDCC